MMLHPRPVTRTETRLGVMDPSPTGEGPTHGVGAAEPNGASLAELPQQPVFHPGQVLDNTYRILRLIGEGGMGAVYEATHARLAGRYAIKVILRGLSTNPEAAARFDREARITSWLQHPNIVQVIDFNRLPDGTEYLVMEYLHGEPLAARLRRVGALPFDAVAGIVEQIAAALTAAHSHGIVHRDLKPDNVFLLPVQGSAAELVKVLDFGISKVHEGSQAFRGPQSGLMGTPQYMAPEQCRGQGAAMNGASDQFALAVLTFEMLTGFSPFAGDSVGTVLSRVLYEHPPAMEVDPAIERVVRRGLAKAPQERFPSIVGFAQALRAAINGRPGGAAARAASARPSADAAAKEVITESRLDRPARPWRWAAATAALIFVAGVLAIGGHAGLGGRLLRKTPLMGLIADEASSTNRQIQRLKARMTPTRVVPTESTSVLGLAPAAATPKTSAKEIPAKALATIAPKTPVAKTPVAKTPVPKTPVPKTPVPKTPFTRAPVAKDLPMKPLQTMAPVMKAPLGRTLVSNPRPPYSSAPRPVPLYLNPERPLPPRPATKPPASRTEVPFDEDETLPLTFEQSH